jgi:predicted esterase
VLGPGGEHKATVIMLHGLGDTGDGWADIGQMFTPVLPNVKFIFPTAPRRAITLNWGMMMTGWYDIPSLEQINRMEDEQGLKESQR